MLGLKTMLLHLPWDKVFLCDRELVMIGVAGNINYFETIA